MKTVGRYSTRQIYWFSLEIFAIKCHDYTNKAYTFKKLAVQVIANIPWIFSKCKHYNVELIFQANIVNILQDIANIGHAIIYKFKQQWSGIVLVLC